MQSLIPIAPFSDLRSRSKKILAQLKNSPVILTMRGRSSAVLLDYDAYNALIEKQQALEQAQPSLAKTAQILLTDYMTDDALTAFAALDGEAFHAA